MSWRDGPWKIVRGSTSNPYFAGQAILVRGKDIVATHVVGGSGYEVPDIPQWANLLEGVDLDAHGDAIHDWLVERGFKDVPGAASEEHAG